MQVPKGVLGGLINGGGGGADIPGFKIVAGTLTTLAGDFSPKKTKTFVILGSAN